jgi:hypothetical protein
MTRPYPRAIAGDLVAIEHPSPDRTVIRYNATPRTKGLAHEVGASTDHSATYTFQCDGAIVMPKLSTGRAEITCPAASDGEHTLEIIGVPIP